MTPEPPVTIPPVAYFFLIIPPDLLVDTFAKILDAPPKAAFINPSIAMLEVLVAILSRKFIAICLNASPAETVPLLKSWNADLNSLLNV